jgi:hypothetical protein
LERENTPTTFALPIRNGVIKSRSEAIRKVKEIGNNGLEAGRV